MKHWIPFRSPAIAALYGRHNRRTPELLSRNVFDGSSAEIVTWRRCLSVTGQLALLPHAISRAIRERVFGAEAAPAVLARKP